MTIDTHYFEKKIEEEMARVTDELKTVGRVNPDNPQDWEPVPQNREVEPADSAEVAESIDAYEDNAGILKQLEIRYNELRDALARIKKGAYGICEVGGEEIEKERLEANPAARTCKKHLG